jgi:dissimilatory sulfite reductase (desulfoviridin) alpha/beta subunit
MIGGKIYLSNTQLTAKSFVPLYMENKLDDIVGVDEKIISAWREQINTRKNAILSIVDGLSKSK